MPRLFVYGSLRRGQANHSLLAGARLLGLAATLPRYTLLDLGAFPALIEGGTTSVEGEIFEVPDSLLPLLDQLEEHPRVYERKNIQLAGEPPAQAYVLPQRLRRGARELTAGRWPPSPIGGKS